MNRRDFFQRILGATLAAKLAPLLPKLPFRPKYYEVSVPISMEEINAVAKANIMPGIVNNFFQSSPLLTYLKDHQTAITTMQNQMAESLLYQPPGPDEEDHDGDDDY